VAQDSSPYRYEPTGAISQSIERSWGETNVEREYVMMEKNKRKM
jgi:hypothetical protein